MFDRVVGSRLTGARDSVPGIWSASQLPRTTANDCLKKYWVTGREISHSESERVLVVSRDGGNERSETEISSCLFSPAIKSTASLTVDWSPFGSSAVTK